MLKPIQRLAAGFERRMAVRRQMLDHLGIDLTADAAPAFQDELRQTLLACASCRRDAQCECWVRNGNPGVPEFCAAHEAYLTLSTVRRREKVA